jgi:hypothetical protein
MTIGHLGTEALPGSDPIRHTPSGPGLPFRSEFECFVGERAREGNLTGALLAFVATPDVPGSPPMPVCLLRMSHGTANGAVLRHLLHILATLGRMNVQVMRVAGDGDRKLSA